MNNTDDHDDDSMDEQQRGAEVLYGIIHSRYILTGQGLIAMVFFLFLYNEVFVSLLTYLISFS